MANKLTDKMPQDLRVKVYAPFRTYFDGPANSMTAENQTGPFDVLPKHKNFITLLTACNLTVRTSGKPDFVMPINRGVLHVRANQATVFLDV